jgi:hypothetical protein
MPTTSIRWSYRYHQHTVAVLFPNKISLEIQVLRVAHISLEKDTSCYSILAHNAASGASPTTTPGSHQVSIVRIT